MVGSGLWSSVQAIGLAGLFQGRRKSCLESRRHPELPNARGTAVPEPKREICHIEPVDMERSDGPETSGLAEANQAQRIEIPPMDLSVEGRRVILRQKVQQQVSAVGCAY